MQIRVGNRVPAPNHDDGVGAHKLLQKLGSLVAKDCLVLSAVGNDIIPPSVVGIDTVKMDDTTVHIIPQNFENGRWFFIGHAVDSCGLFQQRIIISGGKKSPHRFSLTKTACKDEFVGRILSMVSCI